MADTYTLISSVTVGAGGASSIDFTSIPATYTDLQIVLSARNANNNGPCLVTFNNDTGSNYSYRRLWAEVGTSVNSDNGSSQSNINIIAGMVPSSFTSTVFSNVSIYIPNYASSNQKSVSADSTIENNATLSALGFTAGLWTGTSAINRVTLKPTGTDTYVQYSTAYLYGIRSS